MHHASEEADSISSTHVACGALEILCMGMVFVTRLEVSVMTLAVPLIATEFGNSLEVSAWVHLAPNFVGIMTAPPIGKLADMFGHALVWRYSVLILVASAWLSAWSPSFLLLLIGRIGTGIAQSGVFAPGLALMTEGVDPTQRGVIAARTTTADTLGSSVGMLVGGISLDYVSWRWIFRAPAPLMSLVFILSLAFVKSSTAATAGSKKIAVLSQFDWAGAILFGTTSLSLLLALNRGNDLGWTHQLVVMLIFAAALQVPLLIRAELSVAHPILPLWLFKEKSRMLLLLALALSSSGYSATLFLVPIFLQDAIGMTPGVIGKLMAPRPLAAFISSAVMSYTLNRGCIRKLILVRVGGFLLFVSYSVLNITTALPAGIPLHVGSEIQLIGQGLSHFMMTIPANALFIMTIPHSELANVSSAQRVLSQCVGLVSTTLNLSLIRALGSEMKPDCYRPTWIILSVSSLILCIGNFAIPTAIEADYEKGGVEAGDHTCVDIACENDDTAPLKFAVTGDHAENAETIRKVVALSNSDSTIMCSFEEDQVEDNSL